MVNLEQGTPADFSSRCRACRLPRQGALLQRTTPGLTAYPLLTALPSAILCRLCCRQQPEHSNHLTSHGGPGLSTRRSHPLPQQPGTLPRDDRFPGKLHTPNSLTGSCRNVKVKGQHPPSAPQTEIFHHPAPADAELLLAASAHLQAHGVMNPTVGVLWLAALPLDGNQLCTGFLLPEALKKIRSTFDLP